MNILSIYPLDSSGLKTEAKRPLVDKVKDDVTCWGLSFNTLRET